MILTTTGRRSGLPRRTAVEFHQYHGRKYIYSGWGARADWYKNLQVHPHVTIQTADGTERVRAHRIAEAQELAQVYACYTRHALMRLGLRVLGLWRDPAAIQAHPERVYLITFDPTDAPTPPPVGSDLRWVWGVFLAAVFLGWRVSRHGRRGTR
jgi:deazaflavin-dependent oxidoreductase (nitroreductase family)